MRKYIVSLAVILVGAAVGQAADWPTLRGNVQRTGFIPTELRRPFQLVWVRHFHQERISTSAEPIVGDGKVFVGTHSGNLYALSAQTGEPIWWFKANGAFLHSPAYEAGLVVAASTDGGLYAVESATGKLRWSQFVDRGGFAASPTIAEGIVFIGARTGQFVAVDLQTGKVRWQKRLEAPVRQTASVGWGRVFVTAEDLRLRCLATKTGQLLWTSPVLIGQTARDYYPVLWEHQGQRRVVVRTNPVINMSDRIHQDRHFLCRQAKVDDSHWEKLDQWCKSSAALGTPELWAQEQKAIVQYLKQEPGARTFFWFDADSGKLLEPAPVLWAAGCQAVGLPPVVLPEGRALVFYRSAYGNWNLGVAPLVALGLLDLDGRIEPLHHKHAMQPPWNTFWGTADESQNFVGAGQSVLIVHQGTLSGFDLKSKELFHIAGNRDTWGGFRNLPWARNEWHGPGRGGVAVADGRLYWQTGSRILCIAAAQQGPPAQDQAILGEKIPSVQAPPTPLQIPKNALAEAVSELIGQDWAPAMMEPGLHGRQLLFDNSGEVFETLARAYPYLPKELQEQVQKFLAQQWEQYPPFSRSAWYPPRQGQRREFYPIPREILLPAEAQPLYHPFGNISAVWLYAQRCGQWDRLQKSWPQIRACFEDFQKTGWQLNPERGDLWANRYISSLMAMAQMAQKMEDTLLAQQAKTLADQQTKRLVQWWRQTAEQISLPIISDIRAWDNLIGRGDGLFYTLRPHRAKIALFHDLSPELAGILRAEAPEAIEKVWRSFETLCATWHLVGEERQVHYGENFVDPPDLALSAFQALAWLRKASREELAQRVDLPFCRADLAYITKLAILEETR
ncbi:MAG: PQQ-binding-like beta-propeller repeat protein [Thermoguttaceae bacterium]|nr:PQQ-binding-like beta-propeller repeat protein [Thermoguttaceae bacterium]MDW8038589.1 PQQ-binding-like beta-propeller repeat protein [Thermoguttaceae bacterium]